ncbi:FHA domain-containing protein, partial [bacterium]|nr:FHA domain-containing protein [bacterium]
MAMSQVKKKSERRLDRPGLEQTGGPGNGRMFELSREILSLGRTDDNEIVLKSESVSRCHAYLKKLEDGKWLIQDNNSKNGIRLNGKKVREARLVDGDNVTMGEFTFIFHAATEMAVEPEPPAFQAPAMPPKRPVAAAPPRSAKKDPRKQILELVEKQGWIVGIAIGVILGGGLYWKASHNSIPEAAAPVAKATASTGKEASKGEAPATFTSDKNAPNVKKGDMAVSTKPKKPGSDIRDLS